MGIAETFPLPLFVEATSHMYTSFKDYTCALSPNYSTEFRDHSKYHGGWYLLKMVHVPTNIYIDNQNHYSLIFKPTYKLLMLQNVLYEVNDGMSTAKPGNFYGFRWAHYLYVYDSCTCCSGVTCFRPADALLAKPILMCRTTCL